jgi:hypothetical protein
MLSVKSHRTPMTLVGAAVILISLSNFSARAGTLFSFTQVSSFGSAGIHQFDPELWVDATDQNTLHTRFFDRQYTSADIGHTFTLNPSDLASFASILTDGQKEFLFFADASPFSGGEGGPSEPLAIWGTNNDPRIDLKGFSITGITFTLNSMSLSTIPVSPPLYPTGFTTVDYNVTLTVQGTANVPLPQVSWTAAALLGLCGSTRRGSRDAKSKRARGA